MDGKDGIFKGGKKNPEDKYYEAQLSLAAELSTKTPNKENVMETLQDIDKRRDELLDSLQTLYEENKPASLAASTGDETDITIDRVENEREFGFFTAK